MPKLPLPSNLPLTVRGIKGGYIHNFHRFHNATTYQRICSACLRKSFSEGKRAGLAPLIPLTSSGQALRLRSGHILRGGFFTLAPLILRGAILEGLDDIQMFESQALNRFGHWSLDIV